MMTLFSSEGHAFPWPADMCILPDTRGFLVQWRGGLYRIDGESAALIIGLLCSVNGRPRAQGCVWAQLVSLLEGETTRRRLQEGRARARALGWQKSGTDVGAMRVIISCLGPEAEKSLSRWCSDSRGSFVHRAYGYDGIVALVDTLRSGEPSATAPICLLSNLVAGEVADQLHGGPTIDAGTIWAIHWAEGLYVFHAVGDASDALSRLIERAEACADHVDVGVKMMRAGANGAFVPDALPGPTTEQMCALRSITSSSSDAPYLYRIAPSGEIVTLECLAKGLAGDRAGLTPALGVTPGHPEALLDRRVGLLTFDYQFGEMATAAGAIHVWRAGLSHPRHRLGEFSNAHLCLDGFAADSDPGLARLKALMEAFERYGGMNFPGDACWRKAPRTAMTGPVLDADQAAGYLPEQQSRSDFPFEPFHWDQQKIWLCGESVPSGEKVWVLSDLIVWPPLEARGCVQATSSGTAAHRNWNLAVLSALYELIERDSLMMTWLTRSAPPRVPLNHLPAPLPQWIAAMGEYGYRIHVLDATSTLCVPVAMIVAEALRDGIPHVLINGAAAAGLIDAIQKALKELAKTLVFRRRVAGADEPVDHYALPRDHARFYFAPALRAKWAFLLANPRESARITADPIGMSDEEQLRVAGCAVAALGPVAAVDRTPRAAAASGLCVASVVATGLQPIHFGPHLRRLRSRRLQQQVFAEAAVVPGPVDSYGFNPDLHPFS